jgi:hypothetical protein
MSMKDAHQSCAVATQHHVVVALDERGNRCSYLGSRCCRLRLSIFCVYRWR